MISVISTTGKYILQPSLMEMHKQSLEYRSASALWKSELAFFQKLLDQNASHYSSEEDKIKISHFQNLITYYGSEVVLVLRKKLRDHVTHLANMLQKENESDTQYFSEHKGIMEEVAAFEKSFKDLKRDFFTFIEKSLS
jgi:hypothetical protein